MVISTVMMIRQRAIVRAFERAAATTAATACTAAHLGLRPDGLAWYRLVTLAVLRCPGEGRYFLDVANWQRLRKRRRLVALGIAAGLLVLLGVWVIARLG
jgi:hypothetical protein